MESDLREQIRCQIIFVCISKIQRNDCKESFVIIFSLHSFPHFACSFKFILTFSFIENLSAKFKNRKRSKSAQMTLAMLTGNQISQHGFIVFVQLNVQPVTHCLALCAARYREMLANVIKLRIQIS